MLECSSTLTALVLHFELLKHLLSTIFKRGVMFWKIPGFPNKGFDSVRYRAEILIYRVSENILCIRRNYEVG
jgi:hypothetical protein